MNGASGVTGCPVTSLSDGPCVAEDARVAVLVRAQRPGDADVGEHAGEQPHRMLLARILRIRLDVLEVGLVADALDLELGHERRQLAGAVRDHGDRPLGGEELEGREVADVVLAEEHVAVQLLAPNVLRRASRLASELVRRDSEGRGHRPCRRWGISSLSRISSP